MKSTELSFQEPPAYRAGIVYPESGGLRVQVESGIGKIVGRSSADPKTGKQMFWFPDLETFEREAAAIFTSMGNQYNPPVPVVVVISQGERDYAHLKAILEHARLTKSEKPLERLLGDWGEARSEYYRAIEEKAQEQLQAQFNMIHKGYAMAEAGEPLPPPPHDNQWLRLGFESYVRPAPAPTPAPDVLDDKSPPEASAADRLVAIVGDRAVRLGDLAEETKVPADDLRAIIVADPRFAPIPPAQWVKLIKTKE